MSAKVTEDADRPKSTQVISGPSLEILCAPLIERLMIQDGATPNVENLNPEEAGRIRYFGKATHLNLGEISDTDDFHKRAKFLVKTAIIEIDRHEKARKKIVPKKQSILQTRVF